MSASNSRVRDTIRRIALSDPDIRALLDDFKNRGGIASDSIEIEGAADARSICCDGSESGTGTPGSSIRDPGADGAGHDASDGLGDDPANLDMGGGSLIGVKDCATSEPVCFEGSDWVPPEGWEDPQIPPIDPDFEEGVYYFAEYTPEGGSTTTTYHQTCGSARAALPCIGYNTPSNCPFGQSGDIRLSGSDGPICFSGTMVVGVLECDDTFNSICDAPPPLADAWPSDGCINLANKGGKLVASKYDPEAQGTSYLKGVDSIELCDDYGNSFSLAASGSVEGGWKTIDPSNPDDGYLYNAQGEQIARISGSEYADPNV